jgi:hypothetical protein
MTSSDFFKCGNEHSVSLKMGTDEVVAYIERREMPHIFSSKNPEKKNQLQRPGRGWIDNIKISTG